MRRPAVVDTLAWAMAALGFFAAMSSAPLRLAGVKTLPGRAWTALAVAAIGYFAVDYLYVTQSLLGAASRALTLILTLKLHDLKTPRDHLTVYAIVFFLLLAAAASTVSPLFFALLFLFVMAAIFAMTVFGIRKDSAAAGAGEPPAGLFGVRFFASLALVSAASIVVTFALFLILPRVGAGFFQKKTTDMTNVSGFADVVEFGSIGPVKLDDAVVMRVELPGGGPAGGAPLYFKGAVLDSFDGTAWSRTDRRGIRLTRSADGVYRLPAQARTPAAPLEQKILLEPLDASFIFAASDPVAVAGDLPLLSAGVGGSLMLASPPYSRLSYTAWSVTGPDGVVYGGDRPGPGHLDSSWAGVGEARRRVEGLTAEFVKGSSGDLEKARAIEARLKADYGYSLDPKKGGGVNAVDDFLFFSKEGYCEHYATAMAVMLRLAGVPSRVVTGFAEGEYNRYGGYYLVRNRDAHSWVEAYVSGRGWTRFDPTPALAFAGQGLSSKLSLYADALRYAWMRRVVNYSLADQIAASRALEAAASGLFSGLKRTAAGWAGAAGRVNPGAVAAAVAASAALAAFTLWLKGRKAAGQKTPPRFYVEMSRALEKRGFVRRPSETAMELAERSGIAEAVVVTRAFEAIRYGGRTLDGRTEAAVKRAVEALKGRGARRAG